MSKAVEKLLILAAQFEKSAKDIEQPKEFDEDYEKWLKMKSDADESEPITVRQPTLRPPPEKVVVELPLEEDIHEKIRRMNEESDRRANLLHEKEFPDGEVPLTPVVLEAALQYEKVVEAFLSEGKEGRKLDPNAAVRNRGKVCVPAERAKDKKDHFPINNINQARDALSRVGEYSAAPPWWGGDLKALKDLVYRKVHSEYPSIGKDKASKK